MKLRIFVSLCRPPTQLATTIIDYKCDAFLKGLVYILIISVYILFSRPGHFFRPLLLQFGTKNQSKLAPKVQHWSSGQFAIATVTIFICNCMSTSLPKNTLHGKKTLENFNQWINFKSTSWVRLRCNQKTSHLSEFWPSYLELCHKCFWQFTPDR